MESSSGRGGVRAPEASRLATLTAPAKGNSVARALVPGSVSWGGRREWVTHTGGRLSMFEVRIHGRGGQGVVTAAGGLLSVAAFLDGKYAQAFPSFGSERTGAPVAAFCRIDDKEIRLREPVTRPDALIVQDATLLHQVAVFDGVAPSGYLLINSMRTLTQLGLGDFVEQFRPERVLAVPATDLAREHLADRCPMWFCSAHSQHSRDRSQRIRWSLRSASGSPEQSQTATSRPSAAPSTMPNRSEGGVDRCCARLRGPRRLRKP